MWGRSLGAFAICAAALWFAPATALASNSTTFHDAYGDSLGCPEFAQRTIDINDVTISSDDAGQLTFHVTTPGGQNIWYCDLTPEYVVVRIDADRDPATGCSGVDFAVSASFTAITLQSYDNACTAHYIGRLDGTVGSGFSAFLDAAQIGSPSSFDFNVLSKYGSSFVYDSAPDSGTWTYDLAASTPTAAAPACAAAARSAPAAGQVPRPERPRKDASGREEANSRGALHGRQDHQEDVAQEGRRRDRSEPGAGPDTRAARKGQAGRQSGPALAARRTTFRPHASPDAKSSSGSRSSRHPRKCRSGSSSVEP